MPSALGTLPPMRRHGAWRTCCCQLPSFIWQRPGTTIIISWSVPCTYRGCELSDVGAKGLFRSGGLGAGQNSSGRKGWWSQGSRALGRRPPKQALRSEPCGLCFLRGLSRLRARVRSRTVGDTGFAQENEPLCSPRVGPHPAALPGAGPDAAGRGPVLGYMGPRASTGAEQQGPEIGTAGNSGPGKGSQDRLAGVACGAAGSGAGGRSTRTAPGLAPFGSSGPGAPRDRELLGGSRARGSPNFCSVVRLGKDSGFGGTRGRKQGCRA